MLTSILVRCSLFLSLVISELSVSKSRGTLDGVFCPSLGETRTRCVCPRELDISV